MAKKTATRRATPAASTRTFTPPARSAAPSRPAAPLRKSTRIRVRAIRLGYYDEIRRREGDVFTIANEQAFSETWMQRVDPHTPERVTTGAQALRKFHDEEMRAKAPGGMLTDAEEPTATGDLDPLRGE
jgi:hypothetical protein